MRLITLTIVAATASFAALITFAALHTRAHGFAPLDRAISVGDVCVQMGAAWFIVSSMPRHHPRVVRTKVAA